jgi:hypothetical protein
MCEIVQDVPVKYLRALFHGVQIFVLCSEKSKDTVSLLFFFFCFSAV